jgi:nitrogen fixation NifU-like protein
LYHPRIIELNRDPVAFGALTDPTHHCEGYNAACGDHLVIDCHLESEAGIDRIVAIAFRGDMCAIAKASASLMCEISLNRSVDDVRRYARDLKDTLITRRLPVCHLSLKSFHQNFESLHHHPSRWQCFYLGWSTLLGALAGDLSASSEYLSPPQAS